MRHISRGHWPPTSLNGLAVRTSDGTYELVIHDTAILDAEGFKPGDEIEVVVEVRKPQQAEAPQPAPVNHNLTP